MARNTFWVAYSLGVLSAEKQMNDETRQWGHIETAVKAIRKEYGSKAPKWLEEMEEAVTLHSISKFREAFHHAFENLIALHMPSVSLLH